MYFTHIGNFADYPQYICQLIPQIIGSLMFELNVGVRFKTVPGGVVVTSFFMYIVCVF